MVTKLFWTKRPSSTLKISCEPLSWNFNWKGKRSGKCDLWTAYLHPIDYQWSADRSLGTTGVRIQYLLSSASCGGSTWEMSDIENFGDRTLVSTHRMGANRQAAQTSAVLTHPRASALLQHHSGEQGIKSPWSFSWPCWRDGGLVPNPRMILWCVMRTELCLPWTSCTQELQTTTKRRYLQLLQAQADLMWGSNDEWPIY